MCLALNPELVRHLPERISGGLGGEGFGGDRVLPQKARVGNWSGSPYMERGGERGAPHTPGLKGSQRVSCHCILPRRSDSDAGRLLPWAEWRAVVCAEGRCPDPAALPRR